MNIRHITITNVAEIIPDCEGKSFLNYSSNIPFCQFMNNRHIQVTTITNAAERILDYDAGVIISHHYK